MMNHTDGWMSGWSAESVWLWPLLGLVILVLLAVVIRRGSKK